MNIVTYAAQNMKPFQDQAFHSVDSLILSCVVYMHFPRVNPALCDWDGVPLPALFTRKISTQSLNMSMTRRQARNC